MKEKEKKLLQNIEENNIQAGNMIDEEDEKEDKKLTSNIGDINNVQAGSMIDEEKDKKDENGSSYEKGSGSSKDENDEMEHKQNNEESERNFQNSVEQNNNNSKNEDARYKDEGNKNNENNAETLENPKNLLAENSVENESTTDDHSMLQQNEELKDNTSYEKDQKRNIERIEKNGPNHLTQSSDEIGTEEEQNQLIQNDGINNERKQEQNNNKEMKDKEQNHWTQNGRNKSGSEQTKNSISQLLENASREKLDNQIITKRRRNKHTITKVMDDKDKENKREDESKEQSNEDGSLSDHHPQDSIAVFYNDFESNKHDTKKGDNLEEAKDSSSELLGSPDSNEFNFDVYGKSNEEDEDDLGEKKQKREKLTDMLLDELETVR